MDSAFCAIADGEHSPLAITPAFVKDIGKNFSLRKRGISFTFEGFKKWFNTFPQIVRHVAKVNLFHVYRLAKIMLNVL